MEITMQVSDSVSPLMQRIIREKPKWLGSSLKSAGYWSQKQIKAGIRSGAPGGVPYARLMPVWMRRRLEAAWGHQPRNSYKPMGKLVNAVGYDKTRADSGIVTVGWLSQSAVTVGTKQEKGFFTKVTDAMRGAFIMAGIYLPQTKTEIAVPARQTYGPMRPIVQRGAVQQVESKLQQYLKGTVERSTAKSDRVYRVYK